MLNVSQRLFALSLGFAAFAVLMAVAAGFDLAEHTERARAPWFQLLLFFLITAATWGVSFAIAFDPTFSSVRAQDAMLLALFALTQLFLYIMIHAGQALQIAGAIVAAKYAVLTAASFWPSVDPHPSFSPARPVP